MGWNDHLIENSKQIRFKEKCPLCDGEFISVREEQNPGFRVSSILRCPHCKKIINHSLDWTYLREEIIK